jgi:two-component system, cell cycle response regulator DivK
MIENGKNSPGAAPDRAGNDATSQDAKKRFILLVDGNAKNLISTGMLLQRLGYDVYVSNSAEDALEIMAGAPPRLVIADLLLPKMNGIELLTRIKQEPATRSVPVILQTSLADPKVEELCLSYGCASFLRKPVEPDSLYSAIQHATEVMPRNYLRLRTFLPADVAGRSASGGTGTPEVITALSENGMYLRTLTPREINSVHPVAFMVERSLIRVRGEVLYAFSMHKGPFNEPGMGMKFVDIPDADRERIRSFIKSQITKDIQAP